MYLFVVSSGADEGGGLFWGRVPAVARNFRRV